MGNRATGRLAKRIAKWTRIAERHGLKMPEPELVQRIVDEHATREAEIRRTRDQIAGCRSVTNVARMLGMRRSALFEWLQGAGWLRRRHGGGWHATSHALSEGWAVQRGTGAVSWPQITTAGFQELARHLGVNPVANPTT
ncbi:phage antirepressor KilAC domain-containing protein [Paraburkholderia ginsengisoli]|uniref:Phage antirepressor KilAC domain-containing protein n=1 Tax=Paraburkholderia ginsengisoli TaxID=311231 RepID=A0A7T4N206_9BURK|nr:phage antirepressor KilAC domain-containing protein [Paraburkholderia ginsengisoli]QQC63801.1 phage antirepressor KilAC domain-containing protein [Paraburkholderia ginsengisoli]